MTSTLAEIGRGLAQPVHDAQQVFRSVLEAMSRPGRVQALPAATLDGLDTAGLGRGTTALLLALLDAETRLWLAPPLRRDGSVEHLRFHTGVRVVEEPAQAAFAVIDAAHASASLWTTLAHGSDEVPQDGATLIVEVESFESGPALVLSGPGIESTQALRVAGLDAAFWQARIALEPAFPRGIDLILCCGERLAALPRSTRLRLEA
jgi:alpha-D-ribose 1-methylphosphonate 5-triphosphate synthase subunit PhnH